MMSHELHHLAEAYALDALEESERIAFERHLHRCPDCQTDVAAALEATVALAESVAEPPPDALRSRVLTAIADEPQDQPGIDSAHVTSISTARNKRRTRLAVLGAAAAVALIAGIGISRLGDDGRSIDDMLALPDLVTTDLTGDRDATLRVLWSDETNEVAVIADQLADPGDGLAYQLWFVIDNDAVPSTVFTPNDGTVRTITTEQDLAPDAWAVTIEPANGSDQPTSDIVYIGEV